MSTPFPPLLSASAAPPRRRLMRSMSASLRVLPLSASLILPTDGLKVDAVVRIVSELVAVVAVHITEVPPRHLHGDAASHDAS